MNVQTRPEQPTPCVLHEFPVESREDLLVSKSQAVSVSVGPSKIGGTGVLAVKRLAKDEVIRQMGIGRRITREEPLRPEDDERPEHCTVIDGRLFLVPSPDRYLNHSCDPNSWLRFEESRILLVARRDIAAGEELTIDYLINNAGGDSWECHCGTTRCRGLTGVSFFDLPEAIRTEYRPLLAPWFVERYRAELEG